MSMKRLTTDTPKGNIEAALNLFYIEGQETMVRGGGPAPEYADISLYDYVRDILKVHIPDVDLSMDNDSLSMLMAEWLFDGPETAEGLVAVLYTAAWAFSEVRQRLATYENTGLEPEEIMGLCKMENRSRLAKMLRWEEAEAAIEKMKEEP